MKPLKPCPFCLTEGAKLIELWDLFDAGIVAHIHCEHCGADGPSIYCEVGGVDAALARARSVWNGRAERYEYEPTPMEPWQAGLLKTFFASPEKMACVISNGLYNRTQIEKTHQQTGDAKMNNLAPVTENIRIVLNVNVDTRGFESIFNNAYKTGAIHEDYEDIFAVKLLKGYNPDGTDRLIVNMA